MIVRPCRLARLSGVAAAMAIAAFVSIPAWAQSPAPAPAKPPAFPAPRIVVPIDPAAIVGTSEPPASAAPDLSALPSDARDLVQQYDQERERLLREVDARLAVSRDRLIQRLQPIQDAETNDGHLDEAVAVRARIRQLQTPGDAAAGCQPVSSSGGATLLRSDGTDVSPQAPPR